MLSVDASVLIASRIQEVSLIASAFCVVALSREQVFHLMVNESPGLDGLCDPVGQGLLHSVRQLKRDVSVCRKRGPVLSAVHSEEIHHSI